MVPVRQSECHLLVILSQVRVLWVRDDELLSQAIGILPSRVRMVPICARLINLSVCQHLNRVPGNGLGQHAYSEVVSHGVSGRNITLCHAWRAVHFICAILVKPVEVQTCCLVSQLRHVSSGLSLSKLQYLEPGCAC